MRGWRSALGVLLVLGLAVAGLWVIGSYKPLDVPAQAGSTVPVEASAPASQGVPADAVGEAGSERVPARSPAAAAVIPASFGTFRGRVIDAATREPVREFVVEFQGAQATKVGKEAPGSQTFQSSDGTFEWDYLPPGAWTVTASAKGYQRFELVGLQLAAGKATAEIVLPLRRGHTLQGRVYDEDTGEGIEGATIMFREGDVGRWEGNFRMRVRATSTKDGSFTLDGVPPGRITLAVHSNEYAGRELDVVVREDTPPVEIALAAGGSISGHLTAADGVTPIAGAASLFSHETNSGYTMRTNASGQFSYQNLPPGRYSVRGRDGSGSVTREVELSSNQHIEGLVLALNAGHGIRGVVTGLRPDDLERVIVRAAREGDYSDMGETRLDERGAYVVQGVQPGRVVVSADVSMRRQLTKAVDMPADADLTVNFDFPRGARLSGRVTHAGKPVAGVWLSPHPLVRQPNAYNYGASTSQDGEYAIEDLANGDYTIYADNYAGNYRSRVVRVAGDTVFDIDIPSAQLAGRIIEEEGKVPIVGVDVHVWSLEGSASGSHRWAKTDHFGKFELAGLEPGSFLLSAYRAGYAMYRERVSYVAPVSDMSIPLRHDRGVEIKARNSTSGKPLDALYVYELIEGDRESNYRSGISLHLQLDDDGVGYIPGALAGAKLSFASAGHAPQVVNGWNGQSIELRLVPSQTQ